VLEKLVTAYQSYVSEKLDDWSWHVRWVNSTTVDIHAVALYGPPNVIVTHNRTVMYFPSTDAATAYLNAYNLAGYVPSNPTTEQSSVYATALGHPPSVLEVYGKMSGDLSSSRYLQVEQADNLVLITDSTVTSY
jgi:hypothetical protein